MRKFKDYKYNHFRKSSVIISFRYPMKPIYVIILVIIVAVIAFFGYKVYHRSQLHKSFGQGAGGNQSDRNGNEQGGVSQSGDLCAGTGGNGAIVSLGNNVFTIKLKDGSHRIIHLTNQATIKTSASSPSASESDLKVGDRVTLVGGPNSDGSFTAKGVFVCGGN